MFKTVLTILALLIASPDLFAQQVQLPEHRPDSFQLLSDNNYIGTDSKAAVITVTANPVDLTRFDVIAGNIRLLFNPTRAFDYWPEYLYEYDLVAESNLCSEDSSEVLNYRLGNIAIVASPFQSFNSSMQEIVTETIENYNYTGLEPYTGIALFPTNYTIDSASQDSISLEDVSNLLLDDLCSWFERNKNITKDTEHLFLSTSRAIPIKDLKFRRVNLVSDYNQLTPPR